MLKFVTRLASDFKVAAPAASSSYVVRRVLEAIPARARRVVEYGPGDGVVTEALLGSLDPEATLHAVERNSFFVQDLHERLRDPRLTVVHDDALQCAERMIIDGEPPADAILTSIPLSLFSAGEVQRFFTSCEALLRPGAPFIVFHQYSPLVLPALKRQFRSVESAFEPRNFFPCFIFVART